MSWIVKAECYLCGPVELRGGDVTIYGGSYYFTCPVCGFRTEKPAPDDVLALLATAGVLPEPPLEEADVTRMLGEILGVEGVRVYWAPVGTSPLDMDAWTEVPGYDSPIIDDRRGGVRVGRMTIAGKRYELFKGSGPGFQCVPDVNPGEGVLATKRPGQMILVGRIKEATR